MWIYLAVFLSAVAVDTIPIFAPPAWPILVFFLVHYDLNVWAVIALGVTGTTVGRLIFSLYIPWLGHKIFSQREDENLDFLGKRISKSPLSAFVFVLLYCLTPLSTTALFTATSIAKVNRLYIIPGFFVGKLISYSILILTGQYMMSDASGLFSGAFSWKSVVSGIVGLLLIGAFLFVDWQELLLKKHFTMKFKIWK